MKYTLINYNYMIGGKDTFLTFSCLMNWQILKLWSSCMSDRSLLTIQRSALSVGDKCLKISASRSFRESLLLLFLSSRI